MKSGPSKKRLTLFAVPKAFEGHTGVIQRNAISSWSHLPSDIEVILIGGDAGVAEIAAEFGFLHFSEIQRNDNGTPLLNSIFETARRNASADWIMYVNSDIILCDLERVLSALEQSKLDQFLAIGQRTDFDLDEALGFDENWREELQARVSKSGLLASVLCKDYFLFPKTMFSEIPGFSIGRGNWDNWMVSHTNRSQAPVLDVTQLLLAIHQNHDHVHVGGRMKAYVTGPEAKENKRLAGGTNYVSGSMANHSLSADGELNRINKVPLFGFIKDFTRIGRLVANLFRSPTPRK